jgi:hypothetical protein
MRRPGLILLLSLAATIAPASVAWPAGTSSTPVLDSLSLTSSPTLLPGESLTLDYAAHDASSAVTYIAFVYDGPLGNEYEVGVNPDGTSGVASDTVGSDWVSGSYKLDYVQLRDSADISVNYWRDGTTSWYPPGASGPATNPFQFANSDFAVNNGASLPDSPTDAHAVAASHSATVSWTAPANDGGAAISSYLVTASPGIQTDVVDAPATRLSITGLSDGVAYTFTIAATNVAGTGMASTPTAAVTPAPVPKARTYILGDCVHAQYKPKRIVLACGDGNTWLTKIHYTHWGSARAAGAAQLNYVDCTPDCVDGHLVHKPSTFVLDTVRMRKGHLVFGRARVYRSGRLWSTGPLVDDCSACRG